MLGITATVKLQTNRDRDGCTFSKLVMLTSRSKKGNFFKGHNTSGRCRKWSKWAFGRPSSTHRTLLTAACSCSTPAERVHRGKRAESHQSANGGTQSVIDALDAHPDGGTALAFVPLRG